MSPGNCKRLNDDSMAQELDLMPDDPENFVSDFFDEVEFEYDKFQSVVKRIQKLV